MLARPDGANSRTLPALPFALALLAILALGPAPSARAASQASGEEVHESLYNYVIVNKIGTVVSFRRLENGGTVSAVDLADPARQLVSYTSYLFAPALLKPRPASVLNIGLGAGAFNRLFDIAFPDAQLTTVEIDPMILDLAKRYADFAEGPRDKVALGDGRRYLRQTEARYDWIVMDAFVRNSQIPPHLTTQEFFRLVRAHLAPDGVFVANVIAAPPLLASIAATLASVFPNAVYLSVKDRGNIEMMAANPPTLPLGAALAAADPTPLTRLARWSVDAGEIKASQTPIAGEDKATLLTDDFAPTEFLGLERH